VLNPHLVKGGWTPEVRRCVAATAACLCSCASAGRASQCNAPMHESLPAAALRQGTDSASELVVSPVLRCLPPCLSFLLSCNPCPSVAQEDALIIQMVDELGLGKWSVIASHLQGRIGKQCRER
jgi:hypothetical protein